MRNTIVYCAAIWLVHFVDIKFCFVFDTEHPIIFSGPPKTDSTLTHFGYSLDLVKPGTQGSGASLWVGAPKDTTPQNGGITSGSLNYCSLDGSARKKCIKLAPTPSTLDNYDDQLFGISVTRANDENEEVWSCAPRFQRPHEKLWTNGLKKYDLMLGQCFVVKARDQTESKAGSLRQVIPLEDVEPKFFGRTNHSSGYIYGSVYSQLGMAAHYNRQRDMMVFGAPGSWNWTGTIVLADRKGSSDPVMVQPWSESVPTTNDYAGYAVTSGKFVKGHKDIVFAYGAPRAGAVRTGSVFVTGFVPGSKSMENIALLSASLAAVDLDGDGQDELLVGSPLFTRRGRGAGSGSGSGGSYEEGRVSVFRFLKEPQVGLRERVKAVEVLSIFGQAGGARFGSAVSSLGDLDGDGLGDFAVGSPYEDQGQGSVRIYFGSKKITSIQGSLQVIKAADVLPPSSLDYQRTLQGFGSSFSSAPHADVDANGLADLAIGSHFSGHAVLLKRRPSVWVEVRISSSLPSLDIENLEELPLNICLNLKSNNFNGNEQGSLIQYLTIDATVTLKADSRTNLILASNQQKLQSIEIPVPGLGYGPEKCFKAATVRMKDLFSPRSNEPPLNFQAEIKGRTGKTSQFSPFLGILDPRQPNSSNLEVPFRYVCKVTDKCKVDLEVQVKEQSGLQGPFVIGSKQVLKVLVTASNLEGDNDPAFLPTLTAPPLPEGLSIRKIPKECREKPKDKGIFCVIPGPLGAGQSYSVLFEFDMSQLKAGQTYLKWGEIIFSSEDGFSEVNLSNNKASFFMDLKTEADLEISSPSRIDTKVYMDSTAANNQEFLTKSFMHTYQIRKYLASPIAGIRSWVEMPISYDQVQLVELTGAFLTLASGQVLPCQPNNDVVRTGAGPLLTSPKSAKVLPRDLTCATPGVLCIQIRCPSFELRSDEVAATISVTADFISSALKKWEDDLEKSADHYHAIVSEGHVRFPQALEESFSIPEHLNKKPDNVMYQTNFTRNVKSIFAGVVWWKVAVSVVCALLLVLLIIVCLVWFKFFQRRKIEIENDMHQGKIVAEETKAFI